MVASLRRCWRLASISWLSYEIRTCVTTLTRVRGDTGDTFSGLVESALFGDAGDFTLSKDRESASPLNFLDKNSPDLNDSPRISLSTGIVYSEEICEVSILKGTSGPGILTLISSWTTSLFLLWAPPSIVDLFSAWPDNSLSVFIFYYSPLFFAIWFKLTKIGTGTGSFVFQPRVLGSE